MNSATMLPAGLRSSPGTSTTTSSSARETFIRHYSSLRRELEHRTELGVLLFACDDRGITAATFLPAPSDRTAAAIVGRHSEAALRIPEDFSSVSLRHLALTCRAVGTDEARLRVLDLATPLGFADEHGRPLRAITAEGSVFLRIGPLWLLALVTGPLRPTGEDPAAAYECIPERIFIREESGVTRRPSSPPARPRRRSGGKPPRNTTIRLVDEPLASGAPLIDADEEPVGRLLVTADGGVLARQVGPRALERGVLLGRYERCELRSGDCDMVSRVHLLLLGEEGGPGVVAIDTASSNGTYTRDREPITVRRLSGPDDELLLPGRVRVRWEPR